MIKDTARLFLFLRVKKLLITKNILKKIIMSFIRTESISETNLNAVFSLAYDSFLRIDEFIINSKNNVTQIASYCLIRDNVLII